MLVVLNYLQIHFLGKPNHVLTFNESLSTVRERFTKNNILRIFILQEKMLFNNVTACTEMKWSE